MAGLCTMLIAVAVGGGARAQSISNTAYANWTVAGQTTTVASNTVTFSETVIPVTINTYLASQTGTSVLSFLAPKCALTTPSRASVLAAPTSAGVARATVVPASSITIGEALYFTVAMPQGNLSPTAIDHITVVIATTGNGAGSGDQETVVIAETGPNTGIFAGSIATAAVPPQPVSGDCVLSVAGGDTITIQPELPGNTNAPAKATIGVLADPVGEVFSSDDGSPVDGATVSIIDAATGQPATVYADDGATAWPSTIQTGQPVIDGAGISHALAAGEYSFPKIAIGTYRFVVKPPAPYTAPSKLTPPQLAGLKRTDGTALNVTPASYGAPFTVARNQVLQIDIPVDHPVAAARITKIASVAEAQPGDLVAYTVTIANPDTKHAMRGVTLVDRPSALLRLRPGSVRIDGVAAGQSAVFAPDGELLTVALGTLPSGGTRTVTYTATVRTASGTNRAENTATVTDITGTSASANAVVRIDPDSLSSRMTLVGEVTDGGCTLAGAHRGIPGVRVMLEDGSFAITDRNGRYHFDGLVPGSHVVQVAPETLPDTGQHSGPDTGQDTGGRFVLCGGGTRAAGSAISRFVIGDGGALMVANFHAELPPHAAAAPTDAKKDQETAERAAAGADTDWLAAGNGPADFLFPAPDHNPRAPAIRVVIRHAVNQTVALSANGTPVSAITRDATKIAADHSFAISIWRGVPLDGETTTLTADVRNADGSVARHLERVVHFNHVAFGAQIVPERTHLLADGRTRPVVAVRIVDRNGRPVHAGLSGDVAISSPYDSAESIDMMQSRALSGLVRQTPHWTVKGDDGVALIELTPTMASGALQLDFSFVDNDQRHNQTLDGWVKPGKIDWTIVGLAEGSLGARTIADNMDQTSAISSDLGQHARTAFYAKGRVLGKFLLTLAYDSAKQASDQAVLGTIDPRAYYTVYGDGSSRRFDAASRNKLYVRIETATFYAIFGDVEAGFNQTMLAKFQRTATGVKSEARLGGLHLQGFGARTSSMHRHDEIAGNGLSGPYPLSSNAVMVNTDQVVIEVRDHIRPDIVLSSTPLTAYADYTIDPIAGTITFKQPLLARDANLNPQYAVVDYDIDPTIAGANTFVGALRADYTTHDKRLRIGSTVITDTINQGSANGRGSEAAVDVKLQITKTTELRAEGAVSTFAGALSRAWLVEQEHHDKLLDVLAYARSADPFFGVGQVGDTQLGHRRIGVDARRKLGKKFALATSLWLDDGIGVIDSQKQASFKLQYLGKQTQASLGMTTLNENDAVNSGTTTTIDASVTQKMLNNRLELSAATQVPLGSAGAASLPGSVTVAARFALNSHTRLIGSYEVADSTLLSTRTGRIGIDAQPWKGAHLTAGLGDQDIIENAQRAFANFGLAQSFAINRHLTLDATVDTNKVLSGGSLLGLSSAVTGLPSVGTPTTAPGAGTGASGTITGVASGNGIATTSLIEDYKAITVGLAWRKDVWSATLRGEWRDGELSRRHGVTGGAIRQLGDGKMLGSGLTWTHAVGTDGTVTDVLDATVALAWRPHFASLAWLARAEYRSDYALLGSGYGAGASGVPSLATASAGSALAQGLMLGDSHARRLIISASADWTPLGHDDDRFVERSEVSLFAAGRRNFDAYDGYNLSGTTVMAGARAHIGIGEKVEIGGQATVMASPSDHTTRFSLGPSIGLVPVKNVLIMAGYNIKGYCDADFTAANNTARGVYVSMRMKFDTSTFGFLGLDNHIRQ